MISCHHTSGVQRRHDSHVGARGSDTADEPGEEVLVVTLKHLPADELTQKRGHEHRQALNPTALVEEAESGTGHARCCGVGEGVIAGVHLLDLLKLGLKVLNGLVCA